MKILSIGKKVEHRSLDITYIEISSLQKHPDINQYNYIIINGGDGTIRRVIKQLYTLPDLPPFIINPTGSFNVLAKIHHVPKLNQILDLLSKNKTLILKKQNFYKLNDEIFLFSAGNMGDLQHIFLSEFLRFGLFKHGIAKYILSVLFLIPVHIIITPFMLMSSTRFFIFTPIKFIKKLGSFYSEVKEIDIDLENSYNIIELDGDIVTIPEQNIKIQFAGDIDIATV